MNPNVVGSAQSAAAKKKMSLRSLRPLRLSAAAGLCTLLCAAPAVAQQTHLLVITGVPGDDDHAKQFQKWADKFV
ncbi:MAG TPA: hypothetical protein VNG89_26765, partial [Vicinamibacterales bacterium]|nr:hypothetical protein [Vicinamibacterales bacterium]